MRISVYLFLMPLLILVLGCQEKQQTYEEANATIDMTERGKYLVETIGCAHCHSPKKMSDKGPVIDMDRYLMGHPSDGMLAPVDSTMVGPWVLFHPDLTATVGPWGASFAGNLTPDDTGIGSWTLEQFKKAVREGKYKGMDEGRPMMPPMPVYSSMNDKDVEAIFTYLKSVEPISNVPPSYRPPTAAN